MPGSAPPLRASLAWRPWHNHDLAANGAPVKQNFADWMGRSRIRHVVFHATNVDFDSFDITRGDLGAHFGDLEQMRHLENRLGMKGGAMRIMPVWLRMESPLRLKDVGSFHADGIALQLEKKGLLRKGEGRDIERACNKDWTLRSVHDPRLRQVIQDAGYDGVVYRNTQEGGLDSWIALDPRQIKSVFNSGLFLKDNASLSDYGAALELERANRARMAVHAAQKCGVKILPPGSPP